MLVVYHSRMGSATKWALPVVRVHSILHHMMIPSDAHLAKIQIGVTARMMKTAAQRAAPQWDQELNCTNCRIKMALLLNGLCVCSVKADMSLLR